MGVTQGLTQRWVSELCTSLAIHAYSAWSMDAMAVTKSDDSPEFKLALDALWSSLLESIYSNKWGPGDTSNTSNQTNTLWWNACFLNSLNSLDIICCLRPRPSLFVWEHLERFTGVEWIFCFHTTHADAISIDHLRRSRDGSWLV